ncbi:alkaline phosphatase-like protein [Hypoxylon sp. FL1150]|nr:alkaline phosphatase-like protein [Hypoxylon sp. FL1150]
MVLLRQKALLLAANLLVPIGALIFMTGFFRGRSSTPTPAEVIPDREIAAPFDKVVFMVIDALRRLISSGAAVPFTARAASPTLTMSRVKAMTQGTSQTFLDLWLNIANSPNAARQNNVDTWLSRLKNERDPDKSMVYYGTKTWLMLYPEIFDRHDGVDSYYVPDFTIVDQNITRHIPGEMQRDDWKALVMHFPGLDHIAHQGGPYSAHMPVKQKQLDDVVQEIYTAIEQQPHMKDTLFILAGDHGMNEKGNHGGSAPGEIASALTFISPKFRAISKGVECPLKATENYEYYSVIEQVDVVPILAGLLGFSIPMNSLGMFASEFVRLFRTPDDGVWFMLRNAEQMLNLFKTKVDLEGVMKESSVCDANCSGCLTDEGHIACLWGRVAHAKDEWEKAGETGSQYLVKAIDDFSRAVQRSLSVPLNNLHTTRLLVGITSLAVAMILLLMGISLSHIPVDSGVLGFGLVVSLHAATMFVSELVEEEHHYWYWASLAWMAYVGISISRGQSWLWATIPTVLQYLTQCWNQSGDTTYPMVDLIHDFLFEYPLLLWVLALPAYVLSSNSLAKNLGMGSLVSRAISTPLCIMAVAFKLCLTQRDNPELLFFAPQWLRLTMLEVDQTQLLRITWTYIFGCAICLGAQLKLSSRAKKRDVMNGALELANIYLMLQSRPKNLILYPIFDLQLQWFLHSASLTSTEISVTSLVLAQSSFYASGGSNSVASLDITNGFNGIQGYNVTAVFLQTVLSNWVGPVWWTLGALRLLLAWLENQNIVSQKTAKYQNGTATSNGKAMSNGNGHANGHSKALANGNGATYGNKSPATPKTRAAPTLPGSGDAFFGYLSFQTFYTASSSLAVMLACVWLRDDPSLWTALAPKYVYVGLWTVFQQLLINFGLCTVVWWVVVSSN